MNLIGEGSVNEVGNKVVGLGGKKVLLVTDAMLVKLGMAAKIEGILKKRDLRLYCSVELNRILQTKMYLQV